ncbi:putative regulator of cell autolysis [Solitalea canadensis DSM 3403]|uniref:Putative regulator of cell autolysis n=2 Tax=Solitalea canadensis TaxID=995 RepID=H8KT95_SOLCM|nr:putative regulator of cell autolysis [Solitalea canadensis DSM 3403]
MYKLSITQKVKLYSVYWIGYILLLSLIQGMPDKDFLTSLTNELLSVGPRIVFVLLIVEVLMPQLIFKRRSAEFILIYVLLILFFAFIQRLIDNQLIIRYFMKHWQPEPLFSVPVYLYNVIKLQFVVTIPLALKLFYHLAEEKSKVQAIQSEKLQAELFSLRSQLQPHFLFNVLNSLYLKILDKSNDSAEIVLKISDLLRFSVYDVNRKTVSLEEEILYLKNYIDLQQLRFDNRLEMSLSVFGKVDGYHIEPFLILPFVENSYKYCLSDAHSMAWITISINVNDDWLVVKIENSLPEDSLVTQVADTSKSGVGIANVQRRLELLYPDQHQLTVKNNVSSFFVSLKLKMNNVA